MARRSDQDAALDQLYAQVPDVHCKGHCKPSCGPIDMSHRERARIREKTGIKIPAASRMVKDQMFTCPALTTEGGCGAYEVRPMICRVWGASEDLPCRWGCKPDEGTELLTGAETYRLLGSSMDAGGGGTDRSITRAQVDKLLAEQGEDAFSTPGGNEFMRSNEDADYYREMSQEIPASFASSKVLGRVADAYAHLHQENHRPYR